MSRSSITLAYSSCLKKYSTHRYTYTQVYIITYEHSYGDTFTHIHACLAMHNGWIKPSHDACKVMTSASLYLIKMTSENRTSFKTVYALYPSEGHLGPYLWDQEKSQTSPLFCKENTNETPRLWEMESAAWYSAPGKRAKAEKAVFKTKQLLHWFDESLPLLFGPVSQISLTSQDK